MRRKSSRKFAVAATVLNSSNASDDLEKRPVICPSVFESLWWPWIVTIVTVVVRVRYVTLTENFWILHPDEIFQSVEVAFSEVYGYGFRPYEYLSAPTNTNISAERQLLTSGMYGLRSPLYPRLFMAVLYIAKVVGIDGSPFMVCRIFNAVVTSFLPVTVYWFVMKLFNIRLLGFVSCALTAVERHLALFGTHTLVNSFISPFLFCGLAMIIPSEITTGNQNTSLCTDTEAKLADTSIIKTSDQNGNLIDAHSNDAVTKKMDDKTKSTKISVKRTLGIFTSLKLQIAIGGFLLGIVCYIRPDTMLFCTVLMSVYLQTDFMNFKKNMGHLMFAMPGGALAFVACAADDMLWYGPGVISPLQWLKFNVLSGKSNEIFGYQDSRMYVDLFINQNMDIFVNVSLILFMVYCKWQHQELMLRFRPYCVVLFTFVLVVLFYSLLGHKEVRFIHNAIVLFTILNAYCVYIILCSVSKNFNMCTYLDAMLICLITLHAYNSYQNFPSANDALISKWTHSDAKISRDMNVCLDWLRNKNDASGVLIDASIYDTAGLIILKHDVPIIIQVHNEFSVYDLRNKQGYNKGQSNVRAIFNFTDLFHRSNDVYLSKLLTMHDTYNYVISNQTNFRIYNSNFSFGKIFSYGQFNVFHRHFSKYEEDILHNLSKQLPVGLNATVLEYEANWLITNARYHKALERIEGALKLNKTSARLYQQLFYCYSKLNNVKMLHVSRDECFQRFGKDACLKSQPKVTLHQEYSSIG